MIELLPFTLHLTFGQLMTSARTLTGGDPMQVEYHFAASNRKSQLCKKRGVECSDLGTLTGKPRSAVA